jgi:hypothetical protein
LKPRKRKKKEITLKGDEEIDRSFFFPPSHVMAPCAKIAEAYGRSPLIFFIFGCSYINHEVV